MNVTSLIKKSCEGTSDKTHDRLKCASVGVSSSQVTWSAKDIYSFIQTFFPQQEIQEVVGVGHAHFSLHLRPTKGGVDIARASPLFCPPQLRKPTPHVSVTEEKR